MMKHISRLLFFISFVFVYSILSAQETLGKDYEMVIGVPGITAEEVKQVEAQLKLNTSVHQVIYCPNHNVFLLFLTVSIAPAGDGKPNTNTTTFMNIVQNASGRTVYKKETTATEMYITCEFKNQN